MVRISDIQNGDVQWETVPFCHINETDIENYLLQENDILFARTGGTVGKSFLVRKTPYPAIYAGYLIRTRYSCFLSPNYLKFFMESQLYWEQLRNGTIATAQPNCNGKTLSKMIVPIPPHNEQIRITDKLKEVLSQVCRYGLAQDRLDNLNFQIQASLKKSILQEAIQGRLVPQIPEEGTAQELLEQIRQEKARLVKEGKLKKSALSDSTIFRGDDNKYYEQVGSTTADITERIPFDVPANWSWVKLATAVNLYTGNSISDTEKKARYTAVEGTEYIGTKDVGFDHKIDYSNGVNIPEQYLPYFKIAPRSSVLLCIEGGSAGRKVAIVDKDVCFGNKLCCLSPYKSMLSKYIFYYLQSPIFFESFRGNLAGIIGGVSVNTLKTLIMPLPPLLELQRIVKHIDELFEHL